MPFVQPTGTTVGQVSLASRPSTTQSDFRQMVGIVQQWNPDCPVVMIKQFLKDAYRSVIDYRLWYGMMTTGQIIVPAVYSTGSVSVTNGSKTVTGVGTVFTSSMVGRQFRIGFTTPIYTIAAFVSATQLTLDLQWGGANYPNVGYSIFQNIVTLGSNVKSILKMVNQQQGYKFLLGMPQAVLDTYDTWRTQMGWTWMAAGMSPSSAGAPQYELYPIPLVQQSFPFLAYIQPPDLSADDSYPATFMRSDVLVYNAISQALVFQGKNSKYYDPNTSRMYYGMHKAELESMAKNDDSLYLQNLQWEYDKWPMTTFGATFEQCHAI